jgi:ubiquinone/menaquinone biosynthesis C-methylase UbiE
MAAASLRRPVVQTFGWRAESHSRGKVNRCGREGTTFPAFSLWAVGDAPLGGPCGGRACRVSTYVLMRILESAPSRYDRGLRILTLGRLDAAYDRLVSHVMEGQHVLDLGCGTGALALRAAARGAWVKGIDVNPQMLEIASERAEQARLDDRIEFVEMGVAEMDDLEAASYNVVMGGLCFSELTVDEVAFALEQARRVLKPGGLLLIGDEVVPDTLSRRVLNAVLRIPLSLVAYLWTQTTTHAMGDLPQQLEDAGFVVESAKRSNLGSFLELVARKPVGGDE